MTPTLFIPYYRVSTSRQHASGLGLEAQRDSVERCIRQFGGTIAAEFIEVESGKRNDRPQLAAAIKVCKRLRARLIVAKFDRLARNAAFLLTLRDSGVDFVAADMPTANRLTVGIMAVFAEHERDMISQRTKEALAQAKKRGVRLGNPNHQHARNRARDAIVASADRFAANVEPVIASIRTAGITSLRGIAAALNARGFNTPRGSDFSAQAVSMCLRRVQRRQENNK